MIREESDAEHELAVNQRRLGFKLGGALLRQDIQDEFDRSIRATVNADMCQALLSGSLKRSRLSIM